MMKIKILLSVAVISILLISACSNGQTNGDDAKKAKGTPGAVTLNNAYDSVSYAWGINLGAYLKSQGYDEINFAVVEKALDDLLKDNETMFGNEEAGKLIQEYGKVLAVKMEEKNKEKAVANKAESAKFLAENGKKEGVVTLPSGLQYKITKEGTGPVPQPGDMVVAHYHGTIINGEVFDSSVDRGQPFEFNVGQGRVIRGWDEAFSMMPVGSKWTLYIPSDLAYGDNPRPGGKIEAGMALIFEVELLDIKPAAQTTQPQQGMKPQQKK